MRVSVSPAWRFRVRNQVSGLHQGSDVKEPVKVLSRFSVSRVTYRVFRVWDVEEAEKV